MNYVAKISTREFQVALQNRKEELEVSIAGETVPVELIRFGGTSTYLFFMNNQSFEVEIDKNETGYIIHHRGRSFKCYVEDERLASISRSLKKPKAADREKEIKSPMPGLVVNIEVEVGQRIKEGQGIIIIEAMKMENEIKSMVDAVVKEIKVLPEQAVEMNQTLIVLE